MTHFSLILEKFYNTIDNWLNREDFLQSGILFASSHAFVTSPTSSDLRKIIDRWIAQEDAQLFNTNEWILPVSRALFKNTCVWKRFFSMIFLASLSFIKMRLLRLLTEYMNEKSIFGLFLDPLTLILKVLLHSFFFCSKNFIARKFTPRLSFKN